QGAGDGGADSGGVGAGAGDDGTGSLDAEVDGGDFGKRPPIVDERCAHPLDQEGVGEAGAKTGGGGAHPAAFRENCMTWTGTGSAYRSSTLAGRAAITARWLMEPLSVTSPASIAGGAASRRARATWLE